MSEDDRVIMGTSPIRVLLIEDHRLVREGLRLLLEREPGLAVAGEAADGEAGLRLFARLAAEGAELEERIAEQEARLAELRDPAVLAREARERFFYVAEGDRLIRVVDEAEAEGDAGTVPEPPDDGPQTWYDGLMGSLEAADDLGDG